MEASTTKIIDGPGRQNLLKLLGSCPMFVLAFLVRASFNRVCTWERYKRIVCSREASRSVSHLISLPDEDTSGMSRDCSSMEKSPESAADTGMQRVPAYHATQRQKSKSRRFARLVFCPEILGEK